MVRGRGVHADWSDFATAMARRADLDGSNVQILAPGTLPYDVAIDRVGAKLYWTIGNKIQRANLDGTGVEDVISSGLTAVLTVAVDSVARKLYWIDHGGAGSLKRSDLTGANIETLVPAIPFPGQGLALTAEARLIFCDGFESQGAGNWADTVP